MDKYKLMPYIKLQHRMLRGRYSEAEGKWRLTVRRPIISESGEVRYEEVEDTCDVLFTGTGTLNRWSWPDIPGLHDFGGQVIHSAAWETGEGGPNADWQDTVASWGSKSVGVIGVVSVFQLFDLCLEVDCSRARRLFSLFQLFSLESSMLSTLFVDRRGSLPTLCASTS